MNCLIIVRNPLNPGFQTLLPSTHSALFPVSNKPLLDYLLDFAVLNRCKKVQIILESDQHHLPDRIANYHSQGMPWGIPLVFQTVSGGRSLDQIIGSCQGTWENGPVLIMDGFFFIHYDKAAPALLTGLSEETGFMASCPTGSLIYAPRPDRIRTLCRAPAHMEFALAPLENLTDLYTLSMEVIAAQQAHYVMPGYTETQGIIQGKDVIVHPGARIKGPAVLGDHVRIMDRAVIGPNAVIGDKSLVDTDARISNAVLMPRSYVGKDQTLLFAMAGGSNLFQPASETLEEVVDPAQFSKLALPEIGLASFFRKLLNLTPLTPP